MMEWKEAVEKEFILDPVGDHIRIYDIPPQWLPIHYYEALNTLFRIENALRVFVYIVLKNQFYDKWVEVSCKDDEAEHSTLRSIAARRISQAKEFGYLGCAIRCPIMHLTTGELIRLITSKAYWKHFKRYFLGKQEIIRNKLDEISSVRNTLAHFRPVMKKDVKSVELVASQALAGVERFFEDVLYQEHDVPTNTSADWYRELSTLVSDQCTLSFSQSQNEEWVRVSIHYDCRIVCIKNTRKGEAEYSVLNIKSPSIVTKCDGLGCWMTYVLEEVPFWHGDKLPPRFSKTIHIIFSHKTLDDQ